MIWSHPTAKTIFKWMFWVPGIPWKSEPNKEWSLGLSMDQGFPILPMGKVWSLHFLGICHSTNHTSTICEFQQSSKNTGCSSTFLTLIAPDTQVAALMVTRFLSARLRLIGKFPAFAGWSNHLQMLTRVWSATTWWLCLSL